MWAIMVKFGRELGLGAIWASLLCVRRTRVAEGGGEDVSGPEVSAKEEAKKLGISISIRATTSRSAMLAPYI